MKNTDTIITDVKFVAGLHPLEVAEECTLLARKGYVLHGSPFTAHCKNEPGGFGACWHTVQVMVKCGPAPLEGPVEKVRSDSDRLHQRRTLINSVPQEPEARREDPVVAICQQILAVAMTHKGPTQFWVGWYSHCQNINVRIFRGGRKSSANLPDAYCHDIYFSHFATQADLLDRLGGVLREMQAIAAEEGKQEAAS